MKTRRFILLTAVVAALAIGLVIVMGARLDRVTEEEIVTRFSQRQLLLAEQTAAAIQSVFDKTQQYLLHFKDAPGPTHLADALAMEDEEGIATWQRVTEQGFSSCLRSHPNYAQIRYIDAGGQEIVVVDSDGATVRVVPQDQLRSQAEREFFIATQQLDEGEIYVSRLEPALGHGEVGAGLLGVRLATPVFDSQGQRQGIVVINLLADEIRAHIARLTAEEGVDAWVLDERGVEIINVAHPELEGSNTYEYCRQTGDETLMAMVEDMQAGRRGTTTYLWPESAGGPLAVKRLAAYVPIFPAEGQVWSVGTSVPYDTVLAAHRQTHTVLLLLGGSITLIVLIAAILAAQSHRKQAVAETRIRLNEVLSRRVEELAFLNETAHTLTSSLDQQEILTSLLHRATVTLKAEIGSVCLREEDGHLRFAVAVGSHAEQIQGQRLPSDEGVVGWCIREGQPILVPDVREDTRFYSGVDKESGFVTRSILCLPLRVRDETIGALEILNKAGGFDQDDLQLMESVTAQAAIAIQNARLYEQAQEEIAERKRAEEEIKRRGEELEALREISLAISAQLELDTLLQDIVEQGCRLLKVTSGGVHLVDEMSSGLQMVVSHGYTRDYTGTRLAPGEGIAGKVLQSGAPLTVDDYHHWEGQSPGWEAEPITAVLSMPLKHGEQVTGVLNFSEIARARSFDEHDLWLATLFAGQAAIAIENAWLYQAEQSARERADTLRETSRVVGSTLELDDVLSLVLRQTKRVLTYDTASILLFAADGCGRLRGRGTGKDRGSPAPGRQSHPAGYGLRSSPHRHRRRAGGRTLDLGARGR
jgi:GAF domain-containing protein